MDVVVSNIEKLIDIIPYTTKFLLIDDVISLHLCSKKFNSTIPDCTYELNICINKSNHFDFQFFLLYKFKNLISISVPSLSDTETSLISKFQNESLTALNNAPESLSFTYNNLILFCKTRIEKKLSKTSNLKASIFKQNLRYLDIRVREMDIIKTMSLVLIYSNLKVLSLQNCANLIDMHIEFILKASPLLEELSICKSFFITNPDFKAASKYLKFLRITKCSRLKQISNLTTIEMLDLSYSKLNNEALQVFL